jgi:hypothetical protein
MLYQYVNTFRKYIPINSFNVYIFKLVGCELIFSIEIVLRLDAHFRFFFRSDAASMIKKTNNQS